MLDILFKLTNIFLYYLIIYNIMKRSNKKQNKRKSINGNGIFSDIGHSLNVVKNMVVDGVSNAFKTGTNTIKDVTQKV